MNSEKVLNAFIKEQVAETDFFATTGYGYNDLGRDKIERIYINFCNPWPKAKHNKRRLTHTKQLELYKKFLKPGGEIFFKTDDDDLYLATLRYLEEAGFTIYYKTTDLHNEQNVENVLSEHEIMFMEQGIKIKAIKAKY